MASMDENNRVFNAATIFSPEPDMRNRTLYVTSDSTGTVTFQTLIVNDGVQNWDDVDSYAAGEGGELNQGTNAFRFVPSDDTTYFKYA